MSGDDLESRVDALLTEALVPPTLSPAFRASLLRRIDESPRSIAADAWPDILHLASGAVLTVYAASAAPMATAVIVAIGTIATAASYLLLAAVRNSFDESAL